MNDIDTEPFSEYEIHVQPLVSFDDPTARPRRVVQSVPPPVASGGDLQELVRTASEHLRELLAILNKLRARIPPAPTDRREKSGHPNVTVSVIKRMDKYGETKEYTYYCPMKKGRRLKYFKTEQEAIDFILDPRIST